MAQIFTVYGKWWVQWRAKLADKAENGAMQA